MHFITQVLVIGLSWGAAVKSPAEEDDEKAKDIIESYEVLKNSFKNHSNYTQCFDKLEVIESNIRELNRILRGYTTHHTTQEIPKNAHALLSKMRYLEPKGQMKMWEDRIAFYGSHEKESKTSPEESST